MTPIFNVITKQRAAMPCAIWGNRSLNEVLDAQATKDGWRYEKAAPHGERYKASTWSDDGVNYVETTTDWTEKELAEKLAADASAAAADAAAAAAARMASFAPYAAIAGLYRATLRKHFGDNAETNHDVTKTSVSEYFEKKRMAGEITAVEIADAIALNIYFDLLAAWNGTGETWTLPWSELS
jgi:hypothetical protein